jgi:hypothetical protein
MNFYQTTRCHIPEDSDCTYLVVERVLSQELHGLQMRVELVYDGEGLPQQMLWEQGIRQSKTSQKILKQNGIYGGEDL